MAAAKSKYVVLRMLPNDPGLVVAESGLDTIKDAKARAAELACSNSEVVFVPAVLYDALYSKVITTHQMTDPPENVKRLLGFEEPPDGNDPGSEDGGDDGGGDDGGGDEDGGDPKDPTETSEKVETPEEEKTEVTTEEKTEETPEEKTEETPEEKTEETTEEKTDGETAPAEASAGVSGQLF